MLRRLVLATAASALLVSLAPPSAWPHSSVATRPGHSPKRKGKGPRERGPFRLPWEPEASPA
jgi:hypothetical protein